jgi:hypothetical protein
MAREEVMAQGGNWLLAMTYNDVVKHTIMWRGRDGRRPPALITRRVAGQVDVMEKLAKLLCSSP